MIRLTLCTVCDALEKCVCLTQIKKSRKTIGSFPSWSDIFRPKYAARCCCAIVAGSCACRHPLEWQLPQRERQQVISWGQKMLILFHSLHGCRMKRECCCFCCCCNYPCLGCCEQLEMLTEATCSWHGEEEMGSAKDD